MGVFLYSPTGAKEFVRDSMKTTQMVANGYTFEPVKKVVKKEPVPETAESDQGCKDDAIRQAAKAAGIGNWHNKKIVNLVAELKALED